MQTKNTYHFKAFTVQELLVAMVVSSLIIGMMYTIYAQINKQLYVYAANQEEIMVFNQFRQLLSKDVQLSKYIEKKSESEFEVFFHDQSYNYLVRQKNIIRDRNNGAKDTFNLVISQLELEEGTKENVGHQTLTLTTAVLDEVIVLFENKQQSVAKQMNRIFLDEH